MDGSGTLLRGVSSVGSGLLRGLSTDCVTPVIDEDKREDDTVCLRSMLACPVRISIPQHHCSDVQRHVQAIAS